MKHRRPRKLKKKLKKIKKCPEFIVKIDNQQYYKLLDDLAEYAKAKQDIEAYKKQYPYHKCYHHPNQVCNCGTACEFNSLPI